MLLIVVWFVVVALYINIEFPAYRGKRIIR